MEQRRAELCRMVSNTQASPSFCRFYGGMNLSRWCVTGVVNATLPRSTHVRLRRVKRGHKVAVLRRHRRHTHTAEQWFIGTKEDESAADTPSFIC